MLLVGSTAICHLTYYLKLLYLMSLLVILCNNWYNSNQLLVTTVHNTKITCFSNK